MRPLPSAGKPGLPSRVLVALAALLSLGALIRPLVWSGELEAVAADRPKTTPQPVRRACPPIEAPEAEAGARPLETLEEQRNAVPNRERPDQDRVPPRDA